MQNSEHLISSSARRTRRRLPVGAALVVAASVILAGCSENSAGVADLTVTQTQVNSDQVSPPQETSAAETEESPPAQTDEPSSVEESASAGEPDSSTDNPSSDEESSPSSTDESTQSSDESAESTTTSSTESSDEESTEDDEPSESDFDPLALPDNETADPDQPGPETGPKCASNDAYVDEKPTNLEPNLILAWRAVEKAANADDVIVCLNDGKRSRAQQQATFDEYVEQYGEEYAKQFVLPPDKSAHVVGNAIDVQPAAAFNWLSATKGSFGLCRIYDNEAWHFEFKKSYASDGCPKLLPNPLG